jgi:hypothetical protein
MSKNILHQLTSEQQLAVVDWIESDPHRKTDKSNIIALIRNQLGINVTDQDIVDFHFHWLLWSALDVTNANPMDTDKLMQFLDRMNEYPDLLGVFLQMKLMQFAIQRGDVLLFKQISKLSLRLEKLKRRQAALARKIASASKPDLKKKQQDGQYQARFGKYPIPWSRN